MILIIGTIDISKPVQCGASFIWRKDITNLATGFTRAQQRHVVYAYDSGNGLRFYAFNPRRQSFKQTPAISLSEAEHIIDLAHPHNPADRQKRNENFAEQAPHANFVNSPSGIDKTGEKIFLENFGDDAGNVGFAESDNIDKYLDGPDCVLKPNNGCDGNGVFIVKNGAVYTVDEAKHVRSNKRLLKAAIRRTEYVRQDYYAGEKAEETRFIICNGEIVHAFNRCVNPGIIDLAEAKSTPEYDLALTTIGQIADEGVNFYAIDIMHGIDMPQPKIVEINSRRPMLNLDNDYIAADKIADGVLTMQTEL